MVTKSHGMNYGQRQLGWARIGLCWRASEHRDSAIQNSVLDHQTRRQV